MSIMQVGATIEQYLDFSRELIEEYKKNIIKFESKPEYRVAKLIEQVRLEQEEGFCEILQKILEDC